MFFSVGNVEMFPSHWNTPIKENKKATQFYWDKGAFTFQANQYLLSAQYNHIPYFEVFVYHCNGTIAVGVGGSATQGEKILPGWVPKSFGYHSDGKIYTGSKNGAQFGSPFSTGDVIGCGISVNRELFYTKNGKYIGVACKISTPPDTKLYPILGMDKCGISTNFGAAPFVFNLFTLQSGNKPDGKSAADLLELVIPLLEYNEVVSLSRTNKTLFRLCRSNELWKGLVMQQWPTVNPSINVKNFFLYYKRRHRVFMEFEQSNHYQPTVLENCENWEFKCPLIAEGSYKIQRTDDDRVDFCTVCKKNVYIVTNMDELKENVSQGHCIAVDFSETLLNGRRVIYQLGGIMLE